MKYLIFWGIFGNNFALFDIVHVPVTVAVDHTAADENQKVAAALEATASHHVVKSHAQGARFVVHAVKSAFKHEVSKKNKQIKLSSLTENRFYHFSCSAYQ